MCEDILKSTGTCGCRFHRLFYQILDLSTKLSLVYQTLFYLVALLVFDKHFHFVSDTSDYTYYDAKLILDENRNSPMIKKGFTGHNDDF